MKETGDPRIERLVREAIEKHVREEHVSVDYPPMWMSGRRPRSWWLLITCAVSSLAAAATFSALAGTDTSPHLAVVMFCLALLLAGCTTCACFPLEYTLILNFVGVSFLNIGAIFILVDACVLDVHSHVVGLAVFRVGGPALLVLGFFIFGFSVLVTGPWQLMVGSPLLAIGLLLRCSGALLLELKPDSDIPEHLELASVPFIILTLLLVGSKAFMLMKKPWLLQANFLFYGICLFSCGILLASFSLLNKVEDSEEHVQKGLNVLAAFFTFLGSCFFLLRSARAKDALNGTLEDRYPAMNTYIWSLTGFVISAITLPAAVGAVGAAAGAAAFYRPGDGQSVNNALELTAGVAVAIFGVGAVAVPENGGRVNWLPALALLLIAAGLATFDSDGVVGASLGIAGSLALLGSSLPLSVVPILPNPVTWSRVLFHPGNYVLLSSIWFLFAFCTKLAGEVFNTNQASKTGCSILGNALATWSLLLLILHTGMARNLYKSYHQPIEDDADERPEAPTTAMPECIPDINTDVLICGAGPVGLLTCCVIAKSGASVVIVELRDKPITDARFLSLNSATVELMEQFLDKDLFTELLRRAWPNANPFGALLCTGMLHDDAKVLKSSSTPPRGTLMENLDKMDAWTESRTTGSRHASQLSVRIMQSHQETVLKMQADRLPNVKVMYGWKLERFTQHSDGVLSLLSRAVAPSESLASSADSGPPACPQAVRSKYMVACDGPGSTVSSQLESRFDGLLNLAQARSLLVRTRPGIFERVLSKVGSTHQYQIVRRGFGLAVVVAADPANDLWNFVLVFGDKAREASQATVVKEFLGIADGDFELVGTKEWYWNFFVARSFRRGRVFLAGDAAHSWPPFGGMGGNTGYQDAFNLGWKLAAACEGWGSELLLESYAAERRQAVLKTAMFVLGATVRPDLLKQLVSPLFDNAVLRKWMGMMWYWGNSGTHTANHFCQSGIQFGVRISHSPCVMENSTIRPDDPSCTWTPNLDFGSRLPAIPDSRPLAGPGAPARELELESSASGSSASEQRGLEGLSLSTYTLILPNANANASAESALSVKNLAAAIRRAFDQRGVPLNEWHVESDVNACEGNQRVIASLVSGCALLLVRPDRTIAWSAPHPLPLACDLALVEQVASTLTGVDAARTCMAGAFRRSRRHRHNCKYLAWLAGEFLNNLRPFTFQFPKSIPVANQTKDTAIAVVKERAAKLQRKKEPEAASAEFGLTTKYSAGPPAAPLAAPALAAANLKGEARAAHEQAPPASNLKVPVDSDSGSDGRRSLSPTGPPVDAARAWDASGTGSGGAEVTAHVHLQPNLNPGLPVVVAAIMMSQPGPPFRNAGPPPLPVNPTLAAWSPMLHGRA